MQLNAPFLPLVAHHWFEHLSHTKVHAQQYISSHIMYSHMLSLLYSEVKNDISSQVLLIIIHLRM